jgi:medium-chain acyl-[acyl-carrier-protein] hydrolase
MAGQAGGNHAAMQTTRALIAETPYVRRAAVPGARVRLFCFPHAGAGASAYAGWPAEVGPEVEIVAIQLPGREDRAAESPLTDLDQLVRTLVPALRPYFRGDFAFFGHSGGALMAFEVARLLRDLGRKTPCELFLSGHVAPELEPPAPRIHDLSDADFTKAVVELGGTAKSLSSDEAMMGFLLPLLRADFTLWENYSHKPGAPLDVPITALSARNDAQAPIATSAAWAAHTTRRFRHELFDGGHFYLNDSGAQTARRVSALLNDTVGS